jgi:hypothetical protein
MIYIDIDMHIFYMQPPKMSVTVPQTHRLQGLSLSHPKQRREYNSNQPKESEKWSKEVGDDREDDIYIYQVNIYIHHVFHIAHDIFRLSFCHAFLFLFLDKQEFIENSMRIIIIKKSINSQQLKPKQPKNGLLDYYYSFKKFRLIKKRRF